MKEVGGELVDVLGVQIAPVDMAGALRSIGRVLREQTGGYICMTGVHGVMECHRDPGLRAAFAGSLLTAPDGMPTVWVGHWRGFKQMQQITGPDLMLQVVGHPEFAGYTHFLYGGKPGVAEELRDKLECRMPGVKIAGTYTPPFRELTLREEDEFIDEMNALRPDVIWVGISTPKQERFMQRISPRLPATLMFGVGAAFDFHTGRIKDCPQWMKRAGLQWFDRLLQDPRPLWRRYLRNNPAFLWHIVLQLSGLRSYPVHAGEEKRTAGNASSPGAVLRKVESDL